MSGGHSHSHGTAPASGHAGGKHRWRLRLAFLLIASFALIELFYALTAGSLALLSDAGHMAADLVTLGAALVATRIATRPDPAHLVTADAADLHQVLDQARDLLRDRHGISHATLQLEPRDHRGCDEVGW